MTYETLTVETDTRGVVNLTLARPEKKNAMNAQMIAELTHFATHQGSAEDTRVVVLSGAGDMFCAGGDLGWMRDQIHADRETRMREARKLADMLRAMNEMRSPLIGKLHGAAFGGGIGLASICDSVIAEAGTRFGLTETKLGLIPATISPYVIARMGEGLARRVFMSARVFEAEEARGLNLVTDVVDQAGLDNRVEQEVLPYLSVAPNAVASAKALARQLGPRIDEDVINKTIIALADTWEGDEAQEGIDAFLNKRRPKWHQPL